MGVVVTLANQKGGVGKTITATCMASILTEQNHKVLTLSLDPQRNFDMVAGDGILIDRKDVTTPSVLHVLQGKCSISEAIVPSRLGDLVRASSALAQFTGDHGLSGTDALKVKDSNKRASLILKDASDALQTSPETAVQEIERAKEELSSQLTILNEGIVTSDGARLLSKALSNEGIRGKYDYILIDTNPSLSVLTINGLMAADYVVIPAFAEETSAQAIIELRETIETIKHFNETKYLEILGILMTKCNMRTNAFKDHVKKFKFFAKKMNVRLFETKIRQSAKAAEYVQTKTDLIRYSPSCNTSEDYRAFVEEFKRVIQEKEALRYL